MQFSYEVLKLSPIYEWGVWGLEGLHDVPKVIQLASAGRLGLKSDTPTPEQWVRLTDSQKWAFSNGDWMPGPYQYPRCYGKSSTVSADDHSYFTVLLAALQVINKNFKTNWVKWVKPQKQRLWLDMKINRKLNWTENWTCGLGKQLFKNKNNCIIRHRSLVNEITGCQLWLSVRFVV